MRATENDPAMPSVSTGCEATIGCQFCGQRVEVENELKYGNEKNDKSSNAFCLRFSVSFRRKIWRRFPLGARGGDVGA